MHAEAGFGELSQRSTVAPVRSEEATGLAGGGAGDFSFFDDGYTRAPFAQIISNSRSDYARAADHDVWRPGFQGKGYSRERDLVETVAVGLGGAQVNRAGPGHVAINLNRLYQVGSCLAPAGLNLCFQCCRKFR